MNIITKADKKNRRVAAIGMWDGVHRGHQFLIDYIRLEGHNRDLVPAVVTFSDHPLRVVDPERAPRLLSSLEDRMEALERAGAEDVILLSFNDKMRHQTARAFLQHLHKSFGVDLLVVGFNNRFGHNRKGSLDDYRKIGSEIGLDVVGAPEYRGHDDVVSSSKIREYIAEGKVEKAEELLGRPYLLRGIVIEGQRLGRQLGYPTANLRPTSENAVLPGDGVYAAFVTTPDGERRPAVVNVGHRPTVSDPAVPTNVSIEIHIPDFTGYLYDDELAVEFVRRLRDEKKFKNLDQLKKAIEKDIRELKKLTD